MRSLNSFAALRSARQAQRVERTLPVEKNAPGDFSAMSQHSTLATAYIPKYWFQGGSVIDGSIERIFIGDGVNAQRPVNYYQLPLDKAGSLNIALTGLTANADVRLLMDINRNGVIDPGEVIAGSYNLGANSERFSVPGLGNGTYFLEVRGVGGAATNYTLDIEGIAGRPNEVGGPANDTMATAIDVNGHLNYRRYYQGTLDSASDPNDFYRFRLDSPAEFHGSVFGSQANVNMYLYHDENRNGVIDPGDLIGYSAKPGIAIDSIYKEVLPAGDYYVQVQTPANAGSTPYRLDLFAKPVSQAEVTVDIKQILALGQFDSKVPFTKWHQADFFGSVWIDEKKHEFGVFQDQDKVTGLKFTQMIDPNKRFIPITISVKDADFNFPFKFDGAYDWADINPSKNDAGLYFKYDTVTQQLIGTKDTSGFFKENQLITLKGDGSYEDYYRNSHAAEIQFSVSYNPIF